MKESTNSSLQPTIDAPTKVKAKVSLGAQQTSPAATKAKARSGFGAKSKCRKVSNVKAKAKAGLEAQITAKRYSQKVGDTNHASKESSTQVEAGSERQTTSTAQATASRTTSISATATAMDKNNSLGKVSTAETDIIDLCSDDDESDSDIEPKGIYA